MMDDQSNNRNFYDSSNSPYYNQPTHRPIYKDIFATVSLILGILSLISACTGLFSIIFGSLSILFAALDYRKGKKRHTSALSGIIMSCIGMAAGVLMIVYSFVTLPQTMKDPLFQKQMDALTEPLYGESFQDFMKDYYGVELE